MFYKNKVRYMKNKGLTLLELIITIMIITILTSIFIPVYFSYVHRAEIITCEENRRTLLKEMELYIIESGESREDHYMMVFAEILQKYFGNQDVCPVKGNIRTRFAITEKGIKLTVICSKHKNVISKEIILNQEDD